MRKHSIYASIGLSLAAAGVLELECGHLCPDQDIDTPADLEAARRLLARG